MKVCSKNGLRILTVVLLVFAQQGICGVQGPPEASVLKGVSFGVNSARLVPGADAALEELLAELQADPSVFIEIRCRVAASGDRHKDAKLSRERAETLRRWLMNRGVAFYRLQVADPPNSSAAAVSAPPAAERIEIVRIRKSLPVADIPARSFRFEPVADGQAVLHDFQLFNRGEAPLNISKVRTG